MGKSEMNTKIKTKTAYTKRANKNKNIELLVTRKNLLIIVL